MKGNFFAEADKKRASELRKDQFTYLCITMGAIERRDQSVLPETYLELESQSDTKHEYLNGQMVAMAGASVAHSIISNNMRFSLTSLARQAGCIVLDSDVKVFIDTDTHFLYPDASVVCEDIAYFKGRTDSITNPKIIIEVLSDSTEDYDRGRKFAMYRSIPSFEEYVLISQKKQHVEVFSKKGENIWQIRTYDDADGSCFLESFQIAIPFGEIYSDVPNAKAK
ncbi:MAG: Uma2 family endonuclease [Bacteroidia bacterium]